MSTLHITNGAVLTADANRHDEMLHSSRRPVTRRRHHSDVLGRQRDHIAISVLDLWRGGVHLRERTGAVAMGTGTAKRWYHE